MKGKCSKLEASEDRKYPLLLHKNSQLTKLLVNDYHTMLGHPGIYKVLSLLREQFWIPSGFMTVKKIVKKSRKNIHAYIIALCHETAN